MKFSLLRIKDQVLKLYNYIKELERIPFRGFNDDFYDEEDAKPLKRAPRKNNVKVEDLRPQRHSDNIDK